MAGRIRVPIHDQEGVLSPANHKMLAIVRRFRGPAQEIGTKIGSLKVFDPPRRPQTVQPRFELVHMTDMAQREEKIQRNAGRRSDVAVVRTTQRSSSYVAMMFCLRHANGASPCALAMPAVQRIFVSVGGLREFRKAFWAVWLPGRAGDTLAYRHLDRFPRSRALEGARAP